MKIALTLAGLGLCLAQHVAADSYTITVTNQLSEALLTPIAFTGATNDVALFDGDYVTSAAETQILSGHPAKAVAAIGDVGVVDGTDGPPAALLAPGGTVTLEYETDATALRILAMVAPTMLPYAYVTGVADLRAADSIVMTLDRFDIGQFEGTMMRTQTGEAAALIEITRN